MEGEEGLVGGGAGADVGMVGVEVSGGSGGYDVSPLGDPGYYVTYYTPCYSCG